MNIEAERQYHQQLGIALDLAVGQRSLFLERLHACSPEVASRLAEDLGRAEKDAALFDQQLNQLIGHEIQELFGEAEADPLDQRKNLDFYEIQGILGRGGMGVVYRARDLRLDRLVALKVLNERLVKDPLAVQRFKREARAAANLNHPHIVSVYSIEVYESFHFITMELINGPSLAEVLRSGPLPAQKFLEVARALAAALAYAHHHRVVHRDVNPANIMLGPSVKVLDFGLARYAPQASLQQTGLTEPGTIMGTVSYMAPEQLTSGEVDHRSDLFALGVTFFEMLTGRRPFDRASRAETISAILRDKPDPDPLKLSAPLELCQLINACLASQTHNRPKQASEVLDVLNRLRAEDFRPPRFRISRRNWLLATAATLVGASCWWALRAGGRFQPLQPNSDGCRILLHPFATSHEERRLGAVANHLLKQKLELFDRFKVHEPDELREGLAVMGMDGQTPWGQPLLASACNFQGIPFQLRGTLSFEGGRHLVTLELTKPNAVKGFGARVYEGIGELRDAIEYLGDAIKQDLRPFDAQPTKTLRDVSATDPQVLEVFAKALQAETPVQAEIHLLRALELDPGFAPAHRAMGVTLSSLERREQGLAVSMQAMALAQRFSEREQILDKANLEMQLKHYNRADLEFTRYLTNYLPDEYVLRQRAHCAAARCLLDEAVVHMEQAVAVPPIKALNHGMLVIALAEAGREEALEQARRARAWFPKDIYLYWAEGDALAMSGRLNEARTCYRRLKDDPDMARYSPLLTGRLGLIDGQFDEAIRDLGKVTKENLGVWYESKIYLARLNLWRRRNEDARDHLRDLAGMESTRAHVTYLRKLVFTWVELGGLEEAERHLAQLQTAVGEAEGGWLQGTLSSAAGAVALAKGDLQGAVLLLEEAMNQRRDIPTLWWMAHCRMSQTRRWQTALELLDEIRAVKGMAFRNGDADLWVLADREAARCFDQLGQSPAARQRRMRLKRQWDTQVTPQP